MTEESTGCVRSPRHHLLRNGETEPGFLVEQTRVSVDLMLVERPVRLAEEGIDVALRIGPLEDSGLIVRKLDDIQLVVCAAPDYLRRRGEPARPDDLVEQDCLAFGEDVYKRQISPHCAIRGLSKSW